MLEISLSFLRKWFVLCVYGFCIAHWLLPVFQALPICQPFLSQIYWAACPKRVEGRYGLSTQWLGDLLGGYPVAVLLEAHGWNSCWAQSFLTWFAMLACFFSNIIPLPGSGLIQFLPDSQGLGYFVGSPGSSACTEVFLSFVSCTGAQDF